MCKIMRRKNAFVLVWVLSILTLCLSLSGLLAEDAKMKAEDVVAKHLTSIGTPEARAAVQNRVVSGTVQMECRVGGSCPLSGKTSVISEGREIRFGMNFSPINSSAVQIAFNGDKAAVSQTGPGERSTLAQFVYENIVMVKEGLLGGTLSTAWPLLDLTARQAKLEYTGLKTIEGKELHELKYKAKKGGGDVEINLYFDPENFRHVRTRYSLLKIREQRTTYTLVEQFDNFGTIDGLTLPQTYKLEYSADSGRLVIDWDVAISQIVQNQQIDPKYFAIQSY
jgi:hypothetical protein